VEVLPSLERALKRALGAGSKTIEGYATKAIHEVAKVVRKFGENPSKNYNARCGCEKQVNSIGLHVVKDRMLHN